MVAGEGSKCFTHSEALENLLPRPGIGSLCFGADRDIPGSHKCCRGGRQRLSVQRLNAPGPPGTTWGFRGGKSGEISNPMFQRRKSFRPAPSSLSPCSWRDERSDGRLSLSAGKSVCSLLGASARATVSPASSHSPMRRSRSQSMPSSSVRAALSC